MGACGSKDAANEKKPEEKKEQQQSTSSGATNAEPSAPKEEVAAKKMEPIVPSGSTSGSAGASGSGSTSPGEPASTSTSGSTTSTKPSAPEAEKQQGEQQQQQQGEGSSSNKTTQGESGSTSTTGGSSGEEQKGEPDKPQISLEGKSEFQGAVNDKLAEMGETMAKRQAELENSGALAPVDGVSLKDYSYTQAQISKDSSKYDQILSSKGLNRERWEAIDKEWQERMRADGATGSVMSLYGKYFMEAGQGQYGTSAKEAVAVMSPSGQLTGEDPKVGGEEHQMTWERYCEIQGAQTAWALGGKDVNARLKSDFNMNAMDWANISAYWMAKMVADISMATSYGTLTAKYQEIYANKA